jgi:hypothetical protein
MACIEKICEFSGDYPSSLMYGYKKNSIQVCPEYRKQFRGAEHILVIDNKVEEIHNGNGFYEDYTPSKCVLQGVGNMSDEDFDRLVDKGYGYLHNRSVYIFDTEKDFKDFLKSVGKRVVVRYDYHLKVFDKELLGNVDGEYHNYSYDFSTVKRKLKRILRCRELNIVDNTRRKEKI